MHFCQDEFYAILAFIPQLQHAFFWAKFKLVACRASC